MQHLSSQMQQQHEREWRRSKVWELSSQGHSEREIANTLQMHPTTVHRDLAYLRKQAQESLKTHIRERLPEQYQKCMTPNSTMAITKSLQNTTKQNSTFSSSVPVQDTNNVVITSPDQEEQQSSSPSFQQQQRNEAIRLPSPQPPQPIQQPQIFSPPMYPQQQSVIQSQQLLQSVPLVPQIPFNAMPILPPSYSTPFNTLPTLPILPPQTIQPIQIPPRILSYNSYVNSIGSLHIVGEVINESYQPMSFVKITATFYDANNSVIGTDFTYTSPSTLQSGQRAPFDMIVSEGSIPTYLMAYYTLSVDYSDLSWLR